jgi:hypothetical protein
VAAVFALVDGLKVAAVLADDGLDLHGFGLRVEGRKGER